MSIPPIEKAAPVVALQRVFRSARTAPTGAAMLQLPRLTKLAPDKIRRPNSCPGPIERVPPKESSMPRSISNKTISPPVISALR